jgi:Uncharacterised protein conserved in bacteria (DUF2336)
MAGETMLITAATANAATMRMAADDIACLLFPRAGELPSEELQASVRLALKLLVSGIETGLDASQDDELPRSWDLLCRSGLLREPALIEYCLARIAENRIRARLANAGLRMVEQLPAQLIHADDAMLAETARNILVAENQSAAFDARALSAQLSPELLHLLAWRVVAALKTYQVELNGQPDRKFEIACNAMLASRSDAKLLQTSASKLVYFLPEKFRGDLDDVAKSGLPLFIASIASRSGVPADMIYRFVDRDDIEPTLVLFRACGFSPGDALALTQLLRGTRTEDHDLPELLDQYEQLPTTDAARACLGWATQRGDAMGRTV